MRDSLPEMNRLMLPPANVGERPRTGPVDCLCLIIAGQARHVGTADIGCPYVAGYRMCGMPRILLSGASGLIGPALIPPLEKRGDQVYRLVRREPRNQHEVRWDPMQPIQPQLVSGFDAVIHLSGETVAGRWTENKKRRIRESRVISTRNLASALAHADKPPQTFLCASAIGYYGNRGDEVLTEDSRSGQGFLAEVSREWEEATGSAAQAGIRSVNLRIGVVLSRDGGALKQMLLPFRLGLGGRIGNGRQWFSWIHLDDLVAAVLYILGPVAPPFPRSLREDENIDVVQQSPGTDHRSPGPAPITGPVNLVSPNPVTNSDFTKALAKTLKRPALFPVPAIALKLLFGEFANEGLLSSARVIPQKLTDDGFVFRYADVAAALQHLLQ